MSSRLSVCGLPYLSCYTCSYNAQVKQCMKQYTINNSKTYCNCCRNCPGCPLCHTTTLYSYCNCVTVTSPNVTLSPDDDDSTVETVLLKDSYQSYYSYYHCHCYYTHSSSNAMSCCRYGSPTSPITATKDTILSLAILLLLLLL